jgi:uncharacterized protein (DUF58 family)
VSSPEAGLLDAEFRRKLHVLDLVARRIAGREIRGERTSKDRGAGTIFADHRSYSPGDDLRYLDWNVYGRLGVPMTKEFETETSLHVVLLLDASRSMDWGEPGKLDHARRLAAAFGYIALRRLDRVTLIVLGDGAAPPRSFHGKTQIGPLFEALEAVEPGGTTDLAGGTRAGLGTLRHAGMAILLTDFLDRRGFEGVLSELTRHRLRALALHVVSPDEEDPPLDGSLRLVDREDGDARTLHVTERVRRAYREAFARHVRGLESSCAKRRINYLRLSTSVPFDTPLLRLLRRGRMVR